VFSLWGIGVFYSISCGATLDYIKVIIIWPEHPFIAGIIEKRLQRFLNRFRNVKTDQGGQAVVNYLDERLAYPEIKPMFFA
jgi:hypothetical protein